MLDTRARLDLEEIALPLILSIVETDRLRKWRCNSAKGSGLRPGNEYSSDGLI